MKQKSAKFGTTANDSLAWLKGAGLRPLLLLAIAAAMPHAALASATPPQPPECTFSQDAYNKERFSVTSDTEYQNDKRSVTLFSGTVQKFWWQVRNTSFGNVYDTKNKKNIAAITKGVALVGGAIDSYSETDDIKKSAALTQNNNGDMYTVPSKTSSLQSDGSSNSYMGRVVGPTNMANTAFEGRGANANCALTIKAINKYNPWCFITVSNTKVSKGRQVILHWTSRQASKNSGKLEQVTRVLSSSSSTSSSSSSSSSSSGAAALPVGYQSSSGTITGGTGASAYTDSGFTTLGSALTVTNGKMTVMPKAAAVMRYKLTVTNTEDNSTASCYTNDINVDLNAVQDCGISTNLSTIPSKYPFTISWWTTQPESASTYTGALYKITSSSTTGATKTLLHTLNSNDLMAGSYYMVGLTATSTFIIEVTRDAAASTSSSSSSGVSGSSNTSSSGATISEDLGITSYALACSRQVTINVADGPVCELTIDPDLVPIYEPKVLLSWTMVNVAKLKIRAEPAACGTSSSGTTVLNSDTGAYCASTASTDGVSYLLLNKNSKARPTSSSGVGEFYNVSELSEYASSGTYTGNTFSFTDYGPGDTTSSRYTSSSGVSNGVSSGGMLFSTRYTLIARDYNNVERSCNSSLVVFNPQSIISTSGSTN